MVKIGEHIQLVEEARQGREDSMNRLAELAGERLYGYVLRCTLNAEISGDIVQECLLEMAKLLGKLDQVDRFWPWLYRIAFNKIQNHRRREMRRQAVSLSDSAEPSDLSAGENGEGLAHLIGEELKQEIPPPSELAMLASIILHRSEGEESLQLIPPP